MEFDPDSLQRLKMRLLKVWQWFDIFPVEEVIHDIVENFVFRVAIFFDKEKE